MYPNYDKSRLNCTPRIPCPKQIHSQQDKTVTLTSTSIMNSINEGISHYEQKLSQFKNFVQNSLNQNQNIRCKCNNILWESLGDLKKQFGEFANEWKNQLPLICQEFMQIVNKICKLYQQQVERLAGLNSKWQFSYQQLLKSASSTSTCFQAISQKIESEYSKNTIKQGQQQHNQQKPTDQPSRTHKTDPTQIQLKLKQHEITLMREQITELFDQESSFYDKQLTNQMKLKMQDHVDPINQFRLKTTSDQQMTNLTNVLNGTGKNCSNFSTKSSQPNSRKNSVFLKEQYWNNFQQNITTGTAKLNKTVQSGKQNINTATSKQRLSMASQKRKQIKEDEQRGRLSYASGSKLSQLKKNLYKNKNGLENRM